MDGIDAINQKTTAAASKVGSSNEDFRTTASGFAALLQMSGNKVIAGANLSEVDEALVRLDDGRDLVRDSHKLNDTDAHYDETEEVAETDEVEPKDNDRDVDDRDDNTEDDKQDKAANSSDGEEKSEGTGEQQTTQGNDTAANEQAQAAAQAATTNLAAIQGAAATTATTQQVKTEGTGETAKAQVQTTAATQTAVQSEGAGPQTQNQQTAQATTAQTVTATTEPAAVASNQTQAQTAQTATAATNTQATQTSQSNQQATQAQAQQGPEVRQERATTQTVDVRSAAAQQQGQDLSQRLGENTRAQVQVTVNGPAANTGPAEASPYNRFVGYNPAQMMTASTANGQAGQGTATNAVTTPNTPAETPAQQPSAPIPSPAPQSTTHTSQPGTPTSQTPLRSELNAPLPRSGEGTLQSGTGQTSTGNASTAQSTPQAQAPAAQSTQSFAQTVQQSATAERPAQTSNPNPPPVTEQIKVNITKAAKAGLDRVTVQLKPENLGRIEVRMELSQDGKVRAFVTADQKDTLDMLQRDARGLERALQDAGLRTDSNNLHFALRSEGQAGQFGQGKNGGQPGQAHNDNATANNESHMEEPVYDREQAAQRRGGIDRVV